MTLRLLSGRSCWLLSILWLSDLPSYCSNSWQMSGRSSLGQRPPLGLRYDGREQRAESLTPVEWRPGVTDSSVLDCMGRHWEGLRLRGGKTESAKKPPRRQKEGSESEVTSLKKSMHENSRPSKRKVDLSSDVDRDAAKRPKKDERNTGPADSVVGDKDKDKVSVPAAERSRRGTKLGLSEKSSASFQSKLLSADSKIGSSTGASSKAAKSDKGSKGSNPAKKRKQRVSSGPVRSMRRRGGKRGKVQRQRLRTLKEEAKQNQTSVAGVARKPNAIIRNFHVLQKKLAHAQKKADKDLIAKVQDEIEKAGGLNGYQDVLQKSQFAFNSASWAVQEMRFRGLLNVTADMEKVRVLDVGTPNYPYQYQSTSEIEATCIDLNARDEKVRKIDLIQFGRTWCSRQGEAYTAVVLSLVLNMEGNPNKRGQMLAAAAGMVKKGGLLFLSLPKACILNSRYCNPEYVKALARSLCLKILRVKYTNKLALWVFQKRSNSSHGKIPGFTIPPLRSLPGEVVRNGEGRNNFRILLEGSDANKKSKHVRFDQPAADTEQGT